MSTSVSALLRKANTILRTVKPPPALPEPELDYSVFTEDERARFLAVQARVVAPMPHPPGRYFRDDMTPGDFFEYGLLLRLYQALDNGDEPRIAGYRYRLSFTAEQIIALFLSIPKPGETDEELRRYTPYGLLYSGLVREVTGDDEERKYHRIDEIWHWCINAGLVEPLYHSDLKYGREYRYPTWGRV
jgi:hypothetical protein